ncbi:type IV secretory system conjugative DNA transfer family protein [Oscillospiraceae bacterium OttesenSCG-928-F05]|nr:type IV secretory system conjugative DNA transfer family protein [Oscillospiraceae bacterium OttesenSCG-928-F05]
MSGIPFILDERAHRRGLEEWVCIDYNEAPHCLISGRTGSGKTVAAKLLLARSILLAPPELQPVELTVIDPKEDIDFDFSNGLPRFFRGEDAQHGFNFFFDAFMRRKAKEDVSQHLKILFVDEFASLVALIDDKKEKEAAQKKLGLLLALSRSRHFSVQLATQQPSAQIFGAAGSGSREQIGCVCLLGDSGSETQQMLFDGDSREAMKKFGPIGGRAAGWLSINGGLAQPVRVPLVEDMEKLNKVIYDNLAQNTDERGGGAKP